jgi:hypothetical protein
MARWCSFGPAPHGGFDVTLELFDASGRRISTYDVFDPPPSTC